MSNDISIPSVMESSGKLVCRSRVEPDVDVDESDEILERFLHTVRDMWINDELKARDVCVSGRVILIIPISEWDEIGKYAHLTDTERVYCARVSSHASMRLAEREGCQEWMRRFDSTPVVIGKEGEGDW
ncbi:hypothetical protein [Halorubrum halophilum]|uniref:hypothetical protein n=1 Tax=Halorubrum halophilum TaxID=413816 RepID=UPI00186ACA4F|nr:hypothetical protein [Halorubrum halophilum]